jgi:hypothetical protein
VLRARRTTVTTGHLIGTVSEEDTASDVWTVTSSEGTGARAITRNVKKVSRRRHHGATMGGGSSERKPKPSSLPMENFEVLVVHVTSPILFSHIQVLTVV